MKLNTILFIIFLCTTSLLSNDIDKIKMMTEEYPPYNMQKDGKLQGISIEVLELMLQKIGSTKSKKDMELLPWARSYNIIQKQKNTMLFVMARTKQREKLFKWVGPVGSSAVALIARKDKKIKIKSIDDIKKYKIGSVKDDVGEQALKEIGITNTDSISGTNSIEKSIRKLDGERIDLFSYMYEPKSWDIKDFDPNMYENVYTLKKNEFYYAFHKDTDEKIIQQLQNVFDDLKANGIVDQITAKYK